MRELWIAVALGSVGSSCGFITAGAASAASDDSSPSDAPAAITGFAVEDAKTEPAQIRFVLADAEGDSVEVELRYEVDPDGTGPMSKVSGKLQYLFEPRPSPPTNPPPASTSLRNPLVLAASPQGTEHVFDWFFTRETGIGSETFTDDVFVYAQVTGGVQSLTPGANAARLGVGNDPPMIVADANGFADAVLPSEEVVGLVLVSFLVADSSKDQVDVAVEYALADGLDIDAGELPPESAFHPATEAGPGLGSIAATLDGTNVGFLWDPLADLGRTEHDIVLRITPDDRTFESGQPLGVGEPILTRLFRIDNNAAPIIQFDSGALLANPDERRGIPIPYRVIDEESDLVEVIFQWRREGEQFPLLPTDNALLDAILADPDLRRDHHICTEYPRYARGRVIPVDETTVRLPELAQGENWILARGIEGATLELLWPSQFPAPIDPNWSVNPLVSPAAALPIEDGLTALVLDSSTTGGWRVREIELATGEVLTELATGVGIPTAMTLDRAERMLFVSSLGGLWRVDRFELADGVAMTAGSVEGLSASSDGVRGIAATSPQTALITVDEELRLVDFASVPPRSVALFTNLAEPWGIVMDPLSPNGAYLALRTEHRVVHVDLATHTLLPIAAEIFGSTGLPLPNPRALALERGGARLLAVVQRLGGKVFLRGLDLRSAPDLDGDGNANAAVFDLATDFDELASIATGPDTLCVMALPFADGLALGGGVQQRRTIATYDAAHFEAKVAVPFDSTARPATAWRLFRPHTKLVHATPIGVDTSFQWNTSADLPGGSVFLRGCARDTEAGIAAVGGAPKRVRAAVDVAPFTLGDSGTTVGAYFLAAADLDGDGDLDLVSANYFTDTLTVFFQTGPGSFDPAPLTLGGPATTNNPTSIVAADLDIDGDLDLVSANESSDTLTVFFQSGPGSFDPAPLTLGGTATTNGPSSLAAADLDGDGDIDLVSANYLSDTLTVFFQSAPGSFASAPLVVGGPATTSGPSSVAAADLDGDGDLDLISANLDGHTLTVFFQSALGNFATAPLELGDFGTTRDPFSVTAADLDGDGDRDLASANESSETLTVFFQTAPGSFDRSPLTLGGPGTTSGARSVAAADFDGDGDLDLVSANLFSATLTIFFQSTPGSFDPVAPLSLGGGPLSLATADLDGDGNPDLVAAGSVLTVFLQNAPGSFATNPLVLQVLGSPVSGFHRASVAAADLDVDGDLDLASSDFDTATLKVFFQSAPGSFDLAPLTLGGSATTNGPFSVAAADLDGDGDSDLVSANSLAHSLTVFFHSAFGSFDPVPLTLGGAATTRDPRSVVAADLDGDGSLDLASANTLSDDLTVFFQNTHGNFDSSPLTLGGPGVTNGPFSVAAADLDGDGDSDLVSANSSSHSLTGFFQSAPGSFDPVPLTLGGPATTGGPRFVAAADLDGDGDLDVVSANSGQFVGESSTLTVFFQSAPGSFATNPLVLPVPGSPMFGSHPASIAAADLDGDGDLDLVSANESSDTLTTFFQSSPGSFFPAPLTLGGPGTTSGPDSVAAADLDGDGDLDVVSANGGINNSLTIFFGSRE